MSSEQITSQSEIVEQLSKSSKFKIKNCKKLYQNELKQRKNSQIILEKK